MSKKERVNKVLRSFYDILDMGRFWGKAEAYEYMIHLLEKSRFKKTNPKLLLNTLCLCLDSANDALEKSMRAIKDWSPTIAQNISILINTLSKLSDNVRIAVSEKRYEEAFEYVKKVEREIESLSKTHKEAFQVFAEVYRKSLEDMFT